MRVMLAQGTDEGRKEERRVRVKEERETGEREREGSTVDV